MKTCTQCGQRRHNASKRDVCTSCATVCHCGCKKDRRAKECQSCGKRNSALAQWQKPGIEKRRLNMAIANAKFRRYWQDISLDSSWQVRCDGRHWLTYWRDDTKHTVYRYQWVWIQAHGAIPSGVVVHHKNHDSTDDRLENLELMTRADHNRLHFAKS